MKKGDVVNLIEEVTCTINSYTTLTLEKDTFGLILTNNTSPESIVRVRFRLSEYACIDLSVASVVLKINKYHVWNPPER